MGTDPLGSIGGELALMGMASAGFGWPGRGLVWLEGLWVCAEAGCVASVAEPLVQGGKKIGRASC